jgi:RNA polymerase sigma-70 factor (ECF subfamily)
VRTTSVPQTSPLARSCDVNARTATQAADHVADASERLNQMFRAHYARIARVIGRVIRDQARAEELAVDVFLKWWRTPSAHGDRAEGWLVRAAVRLALDELRRVHRRHRLDYVLHLMRLAPPTPEELFDTRSDQERARAVLAAMSRRHAALLVLRSEGLSYQELAAGLKLNPSYVGSLLARAQMAFRAKYEKRYGPTHTR